MAAVGEGVPAQLISVALIGRFESRCEADYADLILPSLRRLFGGYDVKGGN